jgi:hypothetical protein
MMVRVSELNKKNKMVVRVSDPQPQQATTAGAYLKVFYSEVRSHQANSISKQCHREVAFARVGR